MSQLSKPIMPGIVWMKKHWKLHNNPFPTSGIAVLGGSDKRENGLLFRPEVQQEKFNEAIEKYVLGAAYSGLKFGYLWSLGAGLAGDQRGFGKSSMLQYLVEQVNQDFGRSFFLKCGLEESDAAEHPLCAMLSSFDMANARSLAAVFFEATRYACHFRVGNEPTLASRLYERLVNQLGTFEPAALEDAFMKVWDDTRGRNLGPPVYELVKLLCLGDPIELGRFIESVKGGFPRQSYRRELPSYIPSLRKSCWSATCLAGLRSIRRFCSNDYYKTEAECRGRAIPRLCT